MNKNLQFEVKSLTELKRAVETLKEKISEQIIIKNADEGNSLYITTENQDLRIQIFPNLKENLSESYNIEVWTGKEGYEAIINTILGKPKKKTRVMPSILDFANAVLNVPEKTWQEDVSRDLSLSEQEVKRLAKALTDAATMKGAPTQIIEAAKRL